MMSRRWYMVTVGAAFLTAFLFIGVAGASEWQFIQATMRSGSTNDRIQLWFRTRQVVFGAGGRADRASLGGFQRHVISHG